MTSLTLRPNTQDALIYRSVVENNEYRLPAQLREDARIIDIGAHIGTFSYLCWQRGSRRVTAFEASAENADLARRNLADTGVVLHQKAVWRSDMTQPFNLYHSGFAVTKQVLYKNLSDSEPQPTRGKEVEISPDGSNVGGGDVFAQTGEAVDTIALDTIIGSEPVKILKIDCEGSEFPILLTSQKLGQIECIVGEYHLLEKIPPTAQVGTIAKYTLGVLADLLTSQRFRVEFVPHQDPRFAHIGNFFAYNLDRV